MKLKEKHLTFWNIIKNNEALRNAFTFLTDNIHGQTHGKYPWTISMDNTHGQYPWTIPMDTTPAKTDTKLLAN